MKKRALVVAGALLGFSLFQLARAESLGSKLADMVDVSARDARGTSEEPAVGTAPADEAERQVLDAEARDAANQRLQGARDAGK